MLCERRYLPCDVAQFYATAVEPFFQRFGVGQQTADGGEVAGGIVQRLENARLGIAVAIEVVLCLPEGFADFFSVLQLFGFEFQLRLFSGFEVQLVELRELEPQVILLVVIPLCCLLRLAQFAHRLLVALKSLAIAVDEFLVVGNDIHHTELKVLLCEQQVLVLGVDVDKPGA